MYFFQLIRQKMEGGRKLRFSQKSLAQVSWQVARLCHSGNCIRVAADDNAILIGDSKDPEGPVLRYSREEWSVFVEGIRQGDFDHLS